MPLTLAVTRLTIGRVEGLATVEMDNMSAAEAPALAEMNRLAPTLLAEKHPVSG